MAMRESGDWRSTVGYGVSMAAIALAIVAAFQWPRREVNFARAVFGKLIRGQVAAQQDIEWESLKAVGADVGQEYQAFRLEKDREDYRREFIKAFAKGFAAMGGSARAFTNWRVLSREAETVTVAADYPSKGNTLLFTLPRSGERRLVGLAWRKPPEQAAAPPVAGNPPCCSGAPVEARIN